MIRKSCTVVLYAIIIIGLIVSFYNFFNNRSLRSDEANIIINFIGGGYSDLFLPLKHYQIAPIGFLLMEKTIMELLGSSEWVFRLYPFGCFLLSIYLFYLLSAKIFKDKIAILLACAIFSTNLNLIYYGIDAKQYASDVMFTILIAWVALSYKENKSFRNKLSYLLTGILSIFCSNVAIMVLAIFGLYSFFDDYKKSRNLLPISLIGASWCLFFGGYYLLFIHNNTNRSFMFDYWSNYEAFLPVDLFSASFYVFIAEKIKLLFFKVLGYHALWFVPFVFSLFGIWSFIKKGRLDILFMIIGLISLHFILSGLKLYPFETRLVLYLCPFLILLYVQGIAFVYEKMNQNYLLLALPFFAMVNLVPLYLKALPIAKDEIRPILSELEKQVNPEDQIYLYRGCERQMEYYRHRFPKIKSNKNITQGKWGSFNSSNYTPIDLVVKDSSWMLFSHVYPLSKRKKDDEAYILEEIKELGLELIEYKKTTGASLYKIKRNPPS